MSAGGGVSGMPASAEAGRNMMRCGNRGVAEDNMRFVDDSVSDRDIRGVECALAKAVFEGGNSTRAGKAT